MKFLSAQDKQGLTASKHCFWKNLMGQELKEENSDESSIIFVQFCLVMAHFWIFENCNPNPFYILFMTAPLYLFCISPIYLQDSNQSKLFTMIIIIKS